MLQGRREDCSLQVVRLYITSPEFSEGSMYSISHASCSKGLSRPGIRNLGLQRRGTGASTNSRDSRAISRMDIGFFIGMISMNNVTPCHYCGPYWRPCMGSISIGLTRNIDRSAYGTFQKWAGPNADPNHSASIVRSATKGTPQFMETAMHFL